MNFLLVGTTTGSLNIFDVRSATLICIIESFIKVSVDKIIADSNRIGVISKNQPNLMTWDLSSLTQADMTKEASLNRSQWVEKLVNILEVNPNKLTTDSAITSICSSFRQY